MLVTVTVRIGFLRRDELENGAKGSCVIVSLDSLQLFHLTCRLNPKPENRPVFQPSSIPIKNSMRAQLNATKYC
jgi:hypothetical protein